LAFLPFHHTVDVYPLHRIPYPCFPFPSFHSFQYSPDVQPVLHILCPTSPTSSYRFHLGLVDVFLHHRIVDLVNSFLFLILTSSKLPFCWGSSIRPDESLGGTLEAGIVTLEVGVFIWSAVYKFGTFSYRLPLGSTANSLKDQSKIVGDSVGLIVTHNLPGELIVSIRSADRDRGNEKYGIGSRSTRAPVDDVSLRKSISVSFGIFLGLRLLASLVMVVSGRIS
uniref:SHS2_Rpb7-N domain-containing protein n=1 Tax=Haemonchus placei TaxID=6290 RepID=A0A158QRG3_HAEPC